MRAKALGLGAAIDFRAIEIGLDPPRALIEDDAYHYTFDRIEGLPPSCGQASKSDPQSVLEDVIKTMAAHYAFFAARNVDWATAVNKARQQITAHTTERKLFSVLSHLLSHFTDSHVNLKASIGGTEVTYDPTEERGYHHRIRAKATAIAPIDPHAYWNPNAANELLGHEPRTAAGGEITYGLIDGQLGYLRVDSMEGYSLAAADRAMINAVRLFGNAKAVIVDVSLNDGGRDAIARRIAGFFTSARTVGYSKRPGDAKKEQPYQAIPIDPSKAARYTDLSHCRSQDLKRSRSVRPRNARPRQCHANRRNHRRLSFRRTSKAPFQWLDIVSFQRGLLGLQPCFLGRIRDPTGDRGQDQISLTRLETRRCGRAPRYRPTSGSTRLAARTTAGLHVALSFALGGEDFWSGRATAAGSSSPPRPSKAAMAFLSVARMRSMAVASMALGSR